MERPISKGKSRKSSKFFGKILRRENNKNRFQIEEEIQTLRHVLANKIKVSQDLKRKLGISVWKELTDDVNQGLKNVKESQVYVSCYLFVFFACSLVVHIPCTHTLYMFYALCYILYIKEKYKGEVDK